MDEDVELLVDDFTLSTRSHTTGSGRTVSF